MPRLILLAGYCLAAVAAVAAAQTGAVLTQTGAVLTQTGAVLTQTGAVLTAPATRPATAEPGTNDSQSSSITLDSVALRQGETGFSVQRVPDSDRVILSIPLPADEAAQQRAKQALSAWKTAADDTGKAAAKQQLREALQTTFTLRQKTHEAEVTALEAKIKTLRDQLARRIEKQDEIVDFRLQQLLREAEGLGWGAETAR